MGVVEVTADFVQSEYHAVREGPAVVRTRPVVAADTCVLEICTVAVARSGQEDAVAVAVARYLVTIHAVLSCPLCRSVVAVVQLLHLCHIRHLPVFAPVRSCGIVLRQKLVLGNSDVIVCSPGVLFLRLCLTPSEVVAVFLWSVRADVACCPKRAAGQAEVDIFMVLPHRTDAHTDVAIVEVPRAVARAELEVPCFAGLFRVNGMRPVKALTACLADVRAVATACSRKEDTTTILACEFVAINTVYRDPVIGASYDKGASQYQLYA